LSLGLLPFFLGMCSTCLAQSVGVDVATTGNVIAVNSVTNKVYVANAYIGKVTVIDGLTHNVNTVSVGRFPTSIAVNPITNKIYVANSNLCGGVAVIDGRTEEVTRIKAGTELAAIALNTATNEIYVYDPESATIIDGATNKLTNILLPIPSKMPRYSNRCVSTRRVIGNWPDTLATHRLHPYNPYVNFAR
jgi:hypothetical protein